MIKGLEILEQRVTEQQVGKDTPVIEGERRQIIAWRGAGNGAIEPEYGMAHWESGYRRLPDGSVKHIWDILHPQSGVTNNHGS